MIIIRPVPGNTIYDRVWLTRLDQSEPVAHPYLTGDEVGRGRGDAT